MTFKLTFKLPSKKSFDEAKPPRLIDLLIGQSIIEISQSFCKFKGRRLKNWGEFSRNFRKNFLLKFDRAFFLEFLLKIFLKKPVLPIASFDKESNY
jgi:hypothetical protein